ncbi:MAG: hypothetical protein EOM23_01815 [Candidatus Moranbacteria bacterium]|nr:hypothetical protein [Candidatus Moranbacteria bacterium]
MTTITISVKDQANAQILLKVLKSMKFVQSVEMQSSILDTPNRQYAAIYELLEKKASGENFMSIADPVNWQRELRNEWR